VIKVGVFGAGGRMGRTVCGAVAGADGMELVAAVDPFHKGEDVEGVTIAETARPVSETPNSPNSRRCSTPRHRTR